MPRVQYVISVFERWLTATHRGAISHQYIDSYLDEFAFRFNLRQSQNRGELFFRLAQQAVIVDPVTRYNMIHPTPPKAEVKYDPDAVT